LRYLEKLAPGSGDTPSLADLSLDKPLVTLTFKGEGDKGVTQTLKLGRKTIGGRAYVMINDDPAVYVVQHDVHEDVLDKPVWDWRKKSLTMPTEGQVEHVWLTREGQTIEAIKSEGQWALGSPHSGRASSKAIGDLLSSAGGIWVTKFVADLPGDLSIFGLDQPTQTLKVQQPAAPAAEGQPANPAQTVSLIIGAPTDLKRDNYFAALVKDGQQPQTVFTITRADTEKFAKGVDDLRDKRATVVKAGDVNELKIARGSGGGLHLQRGADGWSFAEPGPGFKADSAQVSQLAEKLAGLEASSFQAAPSSGEPVATVTLTATGRPEPEVLKLYAADSAENKQFVSYRNNESVGYVIDAAKLDPAMHDAIWFRDRDVLSVKPESIQSLTIKPVAGPSVTLTQGDAGQWKLEGSDGVELPAVQTLTGLLHPLRAEEWPRTSAKPAVDLGVNAALALQLTVTPKDGTPTQLSVELATRQATLNGKDAFTVSQALVDALTAEFRPRTIVSAGTEQITRAVVTRGDKSTTVTKSGLDYVDGEGKTLDATAAAGLFDALGGLRAVRFVPGPATPGTPGIPGSPGNPVVSVEFTVTAGEGAAPTVQKIDVFADNLARSGDRWFAIEADDHKRLTAELARK
jgi:hypothetical protein